MKVYHSKFVSTYLKENGHIFNNELSAIVIVDKKDGNHAKETNKVINLFKFQSISSIENNIYTYETNEKVRNIKRAFGKVGLHELKLKQCNKFNYLQDNCLYYIDQAITSGIKDDLVGKIIGLIELGHKIYIEVGNKMIEACDKSIFDGSFVTSGQIENPIRIFIGNSLMGFFFTIFFGNLNEIDQLLFLLKKENITIEDFNSSQMRYETICLYPIHFSQSINDKIYLIP